MASERVLSSLAVPLTEIEKAELSRACQQTLNPAGMLLLRRLMWQVDKFPAALERGRAEGYADGIAKANEVVTDLHEEVDRA